MGTCGCFKCGTNRFEPVDLEDDTGAMTLKCMNCGTEIKAPQVFPTEPDRNGDVVSKACLRKISDGLRQASKAASSEGA